MVEALSFSILLISKVELELELIGGGLAGGKGLELGGDCGLNGELSPWSIRELLEGGGGGGC